MWPFASARVVPVWAKLSPAVKIYKSLLAATAALALFLATSAQAQNFVPAAFVNGLTLSGGLPYMSSSSARAWRVGFFADLYYDSIRNEWWGRLERSGGGGALPYEARVQRSDIDFAGSDAVSNFSNGGVLVSDECGPAVPNVTSASDLTRGAAAHDASAAGGGTCDVFTRIVQFEVPTSTAIGEYAYPLKTWGMGRDSLALTVVDRDEFSTASDATKLDVQKSTSRPVGSAVMRRDVMDLIPPDEQNASTSIAEGSADPSPEEPFMLAMGGLWAVVFVARRRLR